MQLISKVFHQQQIGLNTQIFNHKTNPNAWNFCNKTRAIFLISQLLTMKMSFNFQLF